MHVVETAFRNGSAFENDAVVDVADLVSGIVITLDALVLPESVNGKPVGRVLMDLPWPTPPELDLWNDQSFGLHTVELLGELVARKNVILWHSRLPLDSVLLRMRERLIGFENDQRLGSPALPVRMRFQLDGWAIIDADDPERHLNGHAVTQSVQGQTVLRLPTTDEVAGGRFEMWFWFGGDKPGPNFTRFRIEDFSGIDADQDHPPGDGRGRAGHGHRGGRPRHTQEHRARHDPRERHPAAAGPAPDDPRLARGRRLTAAG